MSRTGSKKKLYLVCREVLASSLEKAIQTRGVIYDVRLAEDKLQPEYKTKVGFTKDK